MAKTKTTKQQDDKTGAVQRSGRTPSRPISKSRNYPSHISNQSSLLEYSFGPRENSSTGSSATPKHKKSNATSKKKADLNATRHSPLKLNKSKGAKLKQPKAPPTKNKHKATRQKNFSAKQIAGWDLLDKHTRDFIMEIINRNASTYIDRAFQSEYEQVYTIMENLKGRLNNKLKILQVPSSNKIDVKTLIEEKQAYDNQSDDLQHQIDTVRAAIDLENNKLEDLQTTSIQIQDVKEKLVNMSMNTELHPLMTEEYEDKLDIPSLASW